MQKIDIARAMGLLANIGVLIGIILLIYELNQNRDMVRAQTRNEISRTVIEIGQFWSDDATGDLIERSLRGDSLTEGEQRKLRLWANSWIRLWENMHYQYREGLFADDEFAAVSNIIRRRMNEERPLRTWYCETKDGYSPVFVQELDRWLEEPC